MTATTPPPMPGHQACTECGSTVSESEMIAFGGDWVCQDCKSVYFQRVREGIEPGEEGDMEVVKPVVRDARAVPGFLQSILFIFGFWGLAMAASIVLTVILVVAFTATGGRDMQEASQMAQGPMMWASGPIYLGSYAILIALGCWWSKRSIREILPYRRFNLLVLLPVTVLGLGCTILMSEMDNVVQYFLPAPQFLQDMMKSMVSSGAASFVLLVIVAPIGEEALFRGLILDGYRRRYSKMTAILLSAAMFAVYHINPYQFINAFVLGIIMAWLLLRTNSLWPAMYLHALNNGMAYLAGALNIRIPGYTMPVDGGHNFQPWWFDLTGAVLVCVGLVWLWLFLEGGRRKGDDGRNQPPLSHPL